MWKFLNPLYFRKTGTENDVVLENIDNILEKVSKDSMLVKDELSILTATGEYLDEWGSWFGIRRADGEEDEQYRRRMLSVMSNPKSTIPAIEETIRSYFNNPDMYVKVYEPYKNIKIFNISTFSGSDKFQSDDYWRHSVIDIHLKDVFIDERLKSSIKDVKSAGIGVYYTNYLQFNEGKILVLSKGYNVSTGRKLIISPEVITGDSLLFSSRLSEGKLISGSRETYIEKLTSTELSEVSLHPLSHISRLFDYTVDSLGYMTLDELMDKMFGYNITTETEMETNLTANMSTVESPSHEVITINQFETSVKPNSDYNVELVKSQVSIENIRLSGQEIRASSLLVINDIKDMTVDELANLNYVPLYVGEFEVTTTSV